MRWSLFHKITLSISILIILMSSLLSSFFVRYQTNSIRKGLMAKGSALLHLNLWVRRRTNKIKNYELKIKNGGRNQDNNF